MVCYSWPQALPHARLVMLGNTPIQRVPPPPPAACPAPPEPTAARLGRQLAVACPALKDQFRIRGHDRPSNTTMMQQRALWPGITRKLTVNPKGGALPQLHPAMSKHSFGAWSPPLCSRMPGSVLPFLLKSAVETPFPRFRCSTQTNLFGPMAPRAAFVIGLGLNLTIISMPKIVQKRGLGAECGTTGHAVRCCRSSAQDHALLASLGHTPARLGYRLAAASPALQAPMGIRGRRGHQTRNV